eukprot:16056028-Heterocapsa_arctica.AAC.1
MSCVSPGSPRRPASLASSSFACVAEPAQYPWQLRERGEFEFKDVPGVLPSTLPNCQQTLALLMRQPAQ